MTTVDRDFFLGFVKMHILHHAADEPFYGAWMSEELRRHGYAVGSGTLYPTLQRMEHGGLLSRSSRVVGGKRRKYYTITSVGREVLEEGRQKISELVEEVIGSDSR